MVGNRAMPHWGREEQQNCLEIKKQRYDPRICGAEVLLAKGVPRKSDPHHPRRQTLLASRPVNVRP